MVDDEFFDGFVNGGYLPGVQAVTVANPAGLNAVPLDARMETATLALKLEAGIGADAHACIWFFGVGQTGYVRPGSQWTITQADGTAWVVWGHEVTINTRGDAVLCTRVKE